MPVLDSYLFFDGTCAEAMRFYEKTLGGKIEAMLTYGQSPEPGQCTPGSENLIMHARLLLGDRALMASDTPPSQPKHQGMHGFGLSLNYPSAAEARRTFDALSPGGQVLMPMAKTFWAEAFGCVTDRFGTPWMVGGGAAG